MTILRLTAFDADGGEAEQTLVRERAGRVASRRREQQLDHLSRGGDGPNGGRAGVVGRRRRRRRNREGWRARAGSILYWEGGGRRTSAREEKPKFQRAGRATWPRARNASIRHGRFGDDLPFLFSSRLVPVPALRPSVPASPAMPGSFYVPILIAGMLITVRRTNSGSLVLC